MQGPPTSPAFFSPPVKKQRAGSSPQSRRAQIQKLAQSPTTKVPSASSLMDRARSSLSGPPVLSAGGLRMGSAPPPNGARPTTASPPNGAGPPINASFFQPKKEPTAIEPQIPPVLGDVKNQGGTANSAPPIPPAAGMAAQQRQSDIFPGAQKAPPSAQPSPKTPQPVATPQVTASTLKTEPSATDVDAQIARRLDMQFTPNLGARSKSAPPARPPPPPRTPGPPPPSKSSKSVTFSSPVAAMKERPPEETPAPPPMNGTPFPSKSSRDAGHTPFHSLKDTSPASDGRDMFLKMREAADTPAPKQHQSSPELRLQQQLASVNKEKAQAFREVTKLQGELQRATERGVGFLSPILDKPSRRNIRKTPHPKRRAAQNGNSARELECLTVAATTLPFDYDPQEGEMTSFSVKIRRPFGLDASSTADEQDTWYRYGRLNSKMYRQSATIENETTLEAVTSPLPDGSVLSVHGTEDRVHHLSDGTSLSEVLLLPVQYIDDEGHDKEYDLETVFENLLAARSSYCMALRSAADALLHQPPQAPQPPGSPMASPAAPTQPKETADVGIETEPMDFGPPPPPPEEEMADDVLGNGIYWFFMLIGKVVKGIVLFPVRLIANTIYYAILIAVLAMLWVQVKKHILGGEEMHVGHLLTNAGDVM